MPSVKPFWFTDGHSIQGMKLRQNKNHLVCHFYFPRKSGGKSKFSAQSGWEGTDDSFYFIFTPLKQALTTLTFNKKPASAVKLRKRRSS